LRLDRCPVCNAPLALYARRDENGALVCTNCGYVIAESSFDLGPEWRSFTEEDRTRRSRVGSPLTALVHDYGLTTYIYSRRDPRQRKLAAIQAKLRSHKNRKLIALLQEVNSIVRRFRLQQSVAETYARLVRKLYEEGMIKKNNTVEYMAAALLVAARLENHPLSFNDIIRAFDIEPQQFWRAYNTIVNKLRVRAARPPRPQHFVPKIASRLGLSGEVETLAVKFTALLQQTGLAQGKPPEPLAGAAVYLASILLDRKRNQQDVARAVNATDATIRNRYRDIVDNFYIEVRL
jgi:transcription initiation factor TFIIB